MRPSVRVRAVLVSSLFVAATGLTTSTFAQGSATPPAAPTPTTTGSVPPSTEPNAAMAPKGSDKSRQLSQFLHLINVARPDIAASQGQALLDAGLTASELATIVDADPKLSQRFDEVMARGRGMVGVEDLVQRLQHMLVEGRLELAREPARIEDAISKLNGTLREQMFAKERLAAAGEYAMPKLLKVVVAGGDPALEIAAAQVIVSLKRLAVFPLASALMGLDEVNQRKVCEMLGEIGYPTAAPFLLELAEDPKTTAGVQAAARRAIARLGGSGDDLAGSFTDLSRRFFVGEEALVAYPSETTNNIWHYDAFNGLMLTPVATPIFREVMGMLMARKALSFDAANGRALALYVANDLRRVRRLPKDATDPIFGDSPYTPRFFAMAAGPSADQAVIGLGVDAKDTALVRDAISAVAETGGRQAGHGGLVGGDGRQSLLECLRYPEKRVQYEAALAIGNALPERTFPGDFSVVTLLASAVRDAGTVAGAVVAQSEEDRRPLAGRLSSLGYATLTGGANFAEFENELSTSGGLDLLVVAGSTEAVQRTVNAARLSGMTIAVPIVAVVPETEAGQATLAFQNDRGVVVWPANGTDETFKGATELAFERQSGGRITEEEALDYTTRSLEALKRIALSNSPVFSIRDAEAPLLEALDHRQGGIRLLVADVVALVPGRAAQVKLIDAALNTTDEAEKIELLARAAASARQFGNQAESRQVDALRALIASSSGDLAEAAGRLYGALDLSSQETIKLITKENVTK